MEVICSVIKIHKNFHLFRKLLTCNYWRLGKHSGKILLQCVRPPQVLLETPTRLAFGLIHYNHSYTTCEQRTNHKPKTLPPFQILQLLCSNFAMQ